MATMLYVAASTNEDINVIGCVNSVGFECIKGLTIPTISPDKAGSTTISVPELKIACPAVVILANNLLMPNFTIISDRK